MSWVAVAAAGIGLGKAFLVDKPKEDRQRKLAAATQRYSPWTGLQAGEIDQADPFGSALKFGATGASLHQNAIDSEKQNALSDKYGAAIDSQIALNKAKTAQLSPESGQSALAPGAARPGLPDPGYDALQPAGALPDPMAPTLFGKRKQSPWSLMTPQQ